MAAMHCSPSSAQSFTDALHNKYGAEEDTSMDIIVHVPKGAPGKTGKNKLSRLLDDISLEPVKIILTLCNA